MDPILVNTVGDKIADKDNCRKMKGIYYIIGDVSVEDSGECYLINDKYYKYNTGYIIFDHSVNKYILKKEFNNLVNTDNGLVAFEKNGDPIFGAFTIPEPNNLIYVRIKGGRYICLNEEIVINNPLYLENLNDGEYYNRTELSSYKFIVPKPVNQDYKRGLSYDSRGLTDNVKAVYEKTYKPVYHPILEKSKSDITKGLSFGLEFETTNGFVPQRLCDKLGLIPLRDGSIGGLEYVTVPLEGNKGVQAVIDTVKTLKKRTTYSDDCSLHIHVGNVPRTEEFFIAIYKILFLLQDEIYEMFPMYKKVNYGVKRKHYTKPLPMDLMLNFDNKITTKKSIISNFNILYKFLSMGQDYSDTGNDLSNIVGHPSDPRGNSKWNIKTRYHNFNLIPLLFGNKQTIEFRVHTPTNDCNKVINYMLTCFGIIDYTIRHQDKILANSNNYSNITLNDVVTDVYYKSNGSSLVENLQNYYAKRKQHFYDKTSQGDFVATEDDFNYIPRRRSEDWNRNNLPFIEKKLNEIYKSYDAGVILDELRREINPPIAFFGNEPVENNG